MDLVGLKMGMEMESTERINMEDIPRPGLRVITIDPHTALRAITAKDGFTERLVLDGAPEDMRIVSVNAQWKSGSIKLLVTSADFRPHPEFEEIPELGGVCPKLIRFKIPDEE